MTKINITEFYLNVLKILQVKTLKLILNKNQPIKIEKK